jgi:Cof subfamily protein (haloacid dehalogenase superfamily)
MKTQTFPYKLIAIDLDDTLLGPDKSVSNDNLCAVSMLRQYGAIPVLSSGRRHENIAKFHRDLDLTGYIISSQGAMAKHAETDEVVYDGSVAPELAWRIIQEGLAKEAAVICYHQKAVFAQGAPEYIEEYARMSGDNVVLCNLNALAGQRVEKVLWTAAPERIAAWSPVMREKYAGHADTVVTEPILLEFNAVGVNKAAALAALAQHLAIPRHQVAAFGDGNNDVAMLLWAGLGVAMSHGKASAKAAADVVAPPGQPETSFARGVAAVLARHGASSPRGKGQ